MKKFGEISQFSDLTFREKNCQWIAVMKKKYTISKSILGWKYYIYLNGTVLFKESNISCEISSKLKI